MGYVITDRVTLTTEVCECMVRKANQMRLERSGLKELVSRCSFDTFRTSESWQKAAKQKAADFLTAPKGAWFYIGGHSGSGKTHICTAICSSLIDSGRDVIYFKWREEAPRLKGLVSDGERYDAEMKRLSKADTLYIDDFWKGSVTEADINLSYQLLNDRYNTGKRTIISSEKDIGGILRLDEAVGGRIYERSKGYCIKTPDVNYRL